MVYDTGIFRESLDNSVRRPYFTNEEMAIVTIKELFVKKDYGRLTKKRKENDIMYASPEMNKE